MSIPIIEPSMSAEQPLSGPRLPGLHGGSSVLPPGASPQITDPSVARRIVSDEIQAMAQLLEKTAQMSGEIERSFASIRKHVTAMNSQAKEAATEVVEEASRRKRRRRETAEEGPLTPPPGTSTGDPGYQSSPVSVPDGPYRHRLGRPAPEGGRPERGRGKYTPITEMSFHDARHMSMDDLRGRTASRVNQWMSEWGSRRATITQDAEGVWRNADGAMASRRDLLGQERRLNRIGRVQGAINAFGQGEGLSGAIGAFGGTAARIAGPVGLAVGVGAMALKQAESQREQNRFYQQIHGGSNFAGFAERGREWMAGLQGVGTMGQGRARELFRGISETGLTGDARGGAFDFATEAYRTNGTDIGLSLRMIQAQANAGVTDFEALSEALQGASESAQDFGRNVKQVQEIFARNLEATQANVAGNANAGRLAEGLTNLNTRLEGFDSQEAMTFAGLTSDRSMRTMARNMNMTVTELRTRIGQGETWLFGQGAQAEVERVARAGMTDAQRLRARQIADEMFGPNAKLSPEDANAIAARLAQEDPTFNAARFQAAARARGMGDPSDADAPGMAVLWGLGGMDTRNAFGERPTEGQAGAAPTTLFGKDIVTRDQASKMTGWVGQGGEASRPRSEQALIDQQQALSRAILFGEDAKKFSAEQNRSAVALGERGAFKEYANRVAQTGQRDTTLESLLKGSSGDLRDSKFQVKTADGMRQVTLEQAIKDYSDQLAAGQVKIIGGGGADQTVAQYTGKYDPNRQVGSDQQGAKSGDRVEGKIEVTPTDELRKLLEFRWVPENDEARRRGTPGAAYPDPNRLPTGQGG